MILSRTAPLPEGPFDLAVIGGGINGAAIARDAAGRGRTVVLLEQGDLAQGTSHASSKMIHGGIRYLERLDLALVYESLRERRRLLRLAPHLIEPQSFLLPLYDGRGRRPWMVRVGLWLYDKLAIGRRLGRSEMLGRDETIARAPELEPRGLIGSGVYWDAVMDDARVVVANALGAVESGAARSAPCAVRTRCRVVDHEGSNPITLAVDDTLRGTVQRVKALRVVWAVGPWSPPSMLRPSKGIHIVLPRLPIADGLLLQHTLDGRVFFAIPWRGMTVVGTTETPYDGDPAAVGVDEQDVRYLLDELRRVLPGIAFRPADVLGAFAGVRPLARSIGWFGLRPARVGKVSRHHRIVDEGHGVWRVFGGKFTTYRVIAKDVVDRIFGGRSSTLDAPLPGGEDGGLDAFLSRASGDAAAPMERDELARLWRRYGSRATDIARLVRDEPELAARLGPECDERRAEVAYGVDREFVSTPSDYLERRTSLRFTEDAGRSIYDAVAEVIVARLPEARRLLAQDRERYFAARDHERALAAAAFGEAVAR